MSVPGTYSITHDHRHGLRYGLPVRSPESDTAHRMILYDDKTPVAVLGFDVVGDTVHVSQIQGRLGAVQLPDGWEQHLLGSVIQWASGSGHRKVRVIAAKNGYYWRGYGTPEKDAHNRRMDRHYDATALALGFKPSDDREYYYLDL